MTLGQQLPIEEFLRDPVVTKYRVTRTFILITVHDRTERHITYATLPLFEKVIIYDDVYAITA